MESVLMAERAAMLARDELIPQAALLLGGAAGLVSAVTTFLLWFLPRTYQIGEGFDGIVALHTEPAYMARLWINFFHVFIAFGAYLAVASVLAVRAPISSMVGLAAFFAWCIVEAIGISINIWAVNETWRAAFDASDEANKALIRASLHTFSGLWDGIFFVVLTTFLIGTTCFGVALATGGAFEKVLAVLFLLAAPLTLIIMLDGYFGASLSQWISWSYPTLQPISRGLMGAWLLSLALNKA